MHAFAERKAVELLHWHFSQTYIDVNTVISALLPSPWCVPLWMGWDGDWAWGKVAVKKGLGQNAKVEPPASAFLFPSSLQG